MTMKYFLKVNSTWAASNKLEQAIRDAIWQVDCSLHLSMDDAKAAVLSNVEKSTSTYTGKCKTPDIKVWAADPGKPHQVMHMDGVFHLSIYKVANVENEFAIKGTLIGTHNNYAEWQNAFEKFEADYGILNQVISVDNSNYFTEAFDLLHETGVDDYPVRSYLLDRVVDVPILHQIKP